MTSRIAALASGAGSNLQALLSRFGSPANPGAVDGVIALVGSDRESAGALAIAQRNEIPAVILRDTTDGPGILDVLNAARIDLVVLAGYLRRVPDEVTRAFRARMVNVHPLCCRRLAVVGCTVRASTRRSLMPAFGSAA